MSISRRNLFKAAAVVGVSSFELLQSDSSFAAGNEPYGLTIWPQPGRYSLGHTGILR